MADEITELDPVALLVDLPNEGLRAGQTGTVVYAHQGGAAYEVEFVLAPRRSAVSTVPREQLLKLRGVPLVPAAGS